MKAFSFDEVVVQVLLPLKVIFDLIGQDFFSSSLCFLLIMFIWFDQRQ
jgi:hypothetical protein